MKNRKSLGELRNVVAAKKKGDSVKGKVIRSMKKKAEEV